MKLDNVEDIYPLSPTQQGLLFHSLYAPDSGMYVAQIDYRIGNGLCVGAFKRAWQAVVDRHGILRSSFLWEGLKEPLQVVLRSVELSWEEADWRAMAGAEQDERLGSYLRGDFARGFELGRAPLMRLALLRLSDDVHQFVWSHHHLLLDGWSTGLMFSELFTLYEAYRRGDETGLAHHRPYRDYIAWLQEQDRERAEAFWRQALAGFLSPTPLGVDRAAAEAGGQAGDKEYDDVEARLPAALTARLTGLARRHRLTLNTVLQGTWGVLLARYGGGEDVVFGATVAGRPAELAGVESMLGLFINTLPVRVRVRPDAALLDYLGGIQEQQVEARQYEHSALVDVQGWSEVPRGTPLFESILVFENYPVDEAVREQAGRALGIGGVRMAIRNNYPLTLTVNPGGELSLLVRYDCRRFATATIRRLLGHLAALLAGMEREPGSRVLELPLLSEAERHELLWEWNLPVAAPGSWRCIHELFAEQAGLASEAVAVVCGEARLSYGELARRANRLAHQLRWLGVGPEVRVGICLERSLELVVALLAVHQAGGAYVPLDAELPRERLGLMLRDAAVAVVVSEERLRQALPEESGVVVCCVDGDREAIAGQPATAPCSGVTSGNLAYVIYTSGSTGTPKGVAIEHGQLAHYVAAIAERLGVVSGESYALVSTVAADLGHTVLFPSLARGGCLHLLGREAAADGAALGRYFEERWIDYLKIVPSHLAALRLAGGGGIMPRRALVLGGEAAAREWVAELRAAAPATALVNHYGPTETTVGVLTHRFEGEEIPARVPLGRPLGDTQAYVLDAGLRPAPLGVAGELCIGGRGVGRGYLGRPGETAARFVPHPYGEWGERLYRTGDLGRQRADGEVEFLGRMDRQVKVRGFRIELGEIEATLCRHPGVGQAVALVREDAPGERRLVAYVVGRDGSAPGAGELRSYLAAQLPEPMVPAWTVELASLPRLPNGKLDRRSLPAPEAPAGLGGGGAPQTAVERVLAGIWEAVLGRAGVGVEESFFELGGDSILSIQVIAQAREAGYRLTLKQVFQQPTIAGLARVAVAVGGRAASQEAVRGAVALTPIQRWFFGRELEQPHHYNQAVLLALREPADVAALAQAVRALVWHHDALRLRFERQQEGWRQWQAGLGEEGEAAGAGRAGEAGDARVFSQVDLSGVAAEERRDALAADASRVQASLDLAAGPLLRAVHYGLGEGGERLLVVVHHLAVDGVSWRILLADLARAYEQLRAGRPVELPAKTASFQEWARRLDEHARSDAMAAEAEHWLAAGQAEVPALPVDRAAGGANPLGSSRALSVALSSEETRALLEEVPAVYRTRIDEVLLAALAQAVSSWTGRSRVVVDLEGHGREELFSEVDVSRTVGWFTSLYPVVLELGGRAGPGEALKAVKEQLRAVPHRGIGYGLLRYLGPEAVRERLAALPRAEIRFNYLGQFDQVLGASGVFAAAAESAGASQGEVERRPYRLDVGARVAEGRLRLDWTYGEAVDRGETVAALASSFLRSLRALIAHCEQPEAGGCTPSDFPLAGLDQAALDRWLGTAREVEDVYPLSPLQQGLLFHGLYAPGSGVYFQQLSCRLRGRLEVAAFRRAWQAVVDRHGVLRSAFLWERLAEPLQVVRRGVEVVWQEADWRGLDAGEQQARLDEALRADLERGFDLGRAPLLRLALFRLGEHEHAFAWSYHHLLLDGWSSAAVIRELFALYRAYERGEELSLPAPRPYRDYIDWLSRQDRGRGESFWREALRGFRAPTGLGAERSAGSVGGAAGYRSEVIWLSRSATEGLEAAARRLRVTLNTVLQGGWALLLARYSGERDVVFGATVAGRPAELAGVESMLGLFINTLPVRVGMEPGARLADYLGRLQEQQVEARQHEATPLVDIQGWSEVPRGTALFESLVVFENYPVDESVREQGGAALAIDLVRKHDRTNYPLALEVTPGPRLRLTLDGDGRRFAPAALGRWCGHLRTLLEALAAAPEARLAELSLLSAAERHQLLVEWNATAASYPLDRCVPELFAAQAGRTPEAVAVREGERVLSYGELRRRVDALAARLVAEGVGPEQVVAVLAERGVELLVGLLGILAAGGAYLPLDPEHPAARRAQMIEQSGCRLALAGGRWREALRPGAGGGPAPRVVDLDGGQPPAAALAPRARPGQLAYIVFTSGSTGAPKGAMVEHRGLLNHLCAMIADLGLGAGDRLAQTASQCFDISIWQLLAPLLAGGTVEILSDEVAHDAVRLLAEVDGRGVAMLQLVPSLLRDLLRVLGEQAPGARPRLAALRWLSPTGETLPPELCREWFALYPAIPLLNAYGPAECSDDVSLHVLRAAPGAAARSVPIGRPLWNARLHVLDAGLAPVPIGVDGEIYVGGVGVGRGYADDAVRTAESFVPDPHAATAGARLYRTGDLARYLPDGNLEFVGRTDHQIKLRGFRIEPGEVETALKRHPIIGQSVVVVREDRPGDRRLVAYLVASDGAMPATRELRELVGSHVPPYMVPSAFVWLERLPLTPNGKVDRQALPAPDAARPDLDQAYIGPRTPIEEVLAWTWADVLGLERVGIHDDFFEIGGHSLIATRLVGRLRDVLAVEVPLSAIFERPTVAGLAEDVAAAMQAGRTIAGPPLVRRSRVESLPLSFAQQRLWFLEQLEPGRAAYNELVAVELSGPLHVAALERSFNEVVRRHEVLRTTFEVSDGSPVQMVHPDLTVKLPLLELGMLPEAQRVAEVRRRGEESREPFALGQGPLVRARLLRLGAARHVVLLTMHHIVTDGWSMGVLIREVSALYEAFSHGRPSPLSEPPVQYADYALWQRRWLLPEVLDQQVSYWRQRLAGLAPVLQLPTDRARPGVQTYRGAVEPCELSAEASEGLKRLSRREGVTLYMTLLAGFQTLLGRYAGEEDVAVGSPIAGRTRSELEGLIGFFVNTLVMRTDLSGNPTTRELLRRVREVALGAYAHQDVPFEKLVEELQPERSLTHHPLFQVMFVLQNAPREELRLPGLSIRPLAEDASVAKFDLLLSLYEAGGRVQGTLEYSTDLFAARTARRIVGHLATLLAAMAADPESRPLAVPLLSGEERRQVLVEWNATAAEYPARSCVHELFERQAERTPDATALACGESELSYAELDRRASRLARQLRGLGVGPEVLVGIWMERSLEMAMALLGVLKAGGAYVPLDPEYPRERVTYMAEDSAVAVVLTQQRLLRDLQGVAGRVVCVDGDWGRSAGEERNRRRERAGADDLAYVIYTSGSTGLPKGVEVRHRSLVNFVVDMVRRLGLGRGDRLLSVTSLSFDIFGLELWVPLACGGQVRLASREATLDGALLARTLAEMEATVLQSTPATWRLLLAAGWSGSPQLRLLCGGEALAGELAERLLDKGRELWNLYGPTETTIWSAVHRVELAREPMPIGRPIANTALYVLDGWGQPVPVGVAGELCIGGDGLARGYLGRRELTAERFVPDPFAGRGARLYRTGDLARHLPDGTLEFLGRIDHQVKLRGFRIEPGEIEAVLAAQPGVEQVVVVARKDPPGDSRLVAYVVPEQPGARGGDAQGREAQAAQVAEWQSIWDEAYAGTVEGEDPAFDIRGWVSSYTGQPIPAEEMRDWVEQTVQGILALRPSRVLEIGCGTGLLLFRLAPGCSEYLATDVSALAIRRLQAHVGSPGSGLAHVRLRERAADDFSGVTDGSFDLVILNSVIQYFPDVHYLVQVLAAAVRAVGDGGRVFVGDVRSLPLLDAMHASVGFQQAGASVTHQQLRRRVEQSKLQERELLVDPSFFAALCRHLPRLAGADVRLKRGRWHNELTRFRYDATLLVGADRRGTAPAAPELDWEERPMTLGSLCRLLKEARPDNLRLTRVPNARLARECATLRWLDSGRGPATVGGLREAWAGTVSAGLDPEEIRDAVGELSYAAEMTFSPGDREGRFDVVLARLQGQRSVEPAGLPAPPVQEPGPMTWQEYANQPLQGGVDRQLVRRLRAAVEAVLPSYMVPAGFVIMDALPRTLNGKLNRRALPASDLARTAAVAAFEAPRTGVEQMLAEVWSETLGLDRVGVRDNFFELGGDSFQIMKVVARAGSRGLSIAPRMMFRYQTIAALADGIYDGAESHLGSLLVPFSAGGAGLPFFCVHPAGGRVQFFWSLGRLLGVDRVFYGIRASDRSAHGPGGLRVEDVAAEYVAEIERVRPRGPYCLGGYSIGVFLAFEMARQLVAAGAEVALLALLDAAVYRPAQDDPHAIRHLLEIASRHGGVTLEEEELRQVEPSRLMEHVLREIARRGTLAGDRFEILRAVAPVGYANKLAVDEYMRRALAAPDAYRYPGRITVFRAVAEVAGEAGGASPLGWSARSEPNMGWDRLCADEVEVLTVPGDHGSMLDEPHVGVLSAALRACLARADEAASR